MRLDVEAFARLAGLAALAAALALASMPGGRRRAAGWLALLALGAACLALAIGWRWQRLGFGPFFTLHEILLGNAFSLALVAGAILWRAPATRAGAPAVLGVIVLLAAWAAGVSPAATRPPPSYDSPWLWAHVAVGKLFLGTLLAAAGVAAATLRVPGEGAEDASLWRLLRAAFVFDSLMLVTGAVWAHTAWGRYWAWDPLETWALLTWLALAATLHLRLAWRLPPAAGRALAVGVFALAFLTFFGVPFLSVAPHKGVL